MRPIRKVLFPTRFKHLNFDALQRLMTWRGAGLEEIVFLHVIPRDEVGFVPYGGFDKELAQELKEKAHLRFADWGASLSACGIRWKEIEEVGAPAAKILEVAQREEVGLIALGRSEPELGDSIYPHGLDLDVLRETRVPALLMSKECEDGRELLEHVLVPMDFSSHADRALSVLASLAPLPGLVSLLHIVQPSEIEGLTQEEIDAHERTQRALLDNWVEKVRGLGCCTEAHLLFGDVAEEILSFSEGHRCSVVVMGTHGKRGVRELLLGSASHQIAEKGRLPLLLVPLPR